MANLTDGDPRVTWGLIIDLLDVLEQHGYRKGDDQHTGRAISYLGGLGRLYAGEADELISAEATAS
jgi:hypothetical protein